MTPFEQWWNDENSNITQEERYSTAFKRIAYKAWWAAQPWRPIATAPTNKAILVFCGGFPWRVKRLKVDGQFKWVFLDKNNEPAGKNDLMGWIPLPKQVGGSP